MEYSSSKDNMLSLYTTIVLYIIRNVLHIIGKRQNTDLMINVCKVSTLFILYVNCSVDFTLYVPVAYATHQLLPYWLNVNTQGISTTTVKYKEYNIKKIKNYIIPLYKQSGLLLYEEVG